MGKIGEDAAYQVSHNWFLVEGQDQLVLQGVSIGLVLQLTAFEFFYKEANETRKRNGLKGLLKKKHLEWHARFLHNYITQRGGDFHHVDLVTFYDVNNVPMIENANLVSNSCKNAQLSVAGVVVDKALYQQATSSIDRYYLTSAYGVVDEFAAMQMAREQLEKFNFFYKEYSDNLTSFNISKEEVAGFLRFIEKQIRQVCREIIALTNLVARLAPKIILLTSDAHRIGRIVAQIAKRQGVRTCVIQHGAPIWKYGYVPVVVDKMLVWGEDAFDWFVSHGVSKKKLLVVGNPRFDNFRVDEPVMLKGQQPKLILLPNPIGRALICSLISSFLLAASVHDGPVIIKLHPSETDIDWFYDQIPAHLKQRISISIKPLDQVGISLGDVAVVANSTAGVDVVLLGGAIVNVELPGMPNPIPYSKYMVGVNTVPEKLSEAVVKVQSINQQQWIQNRNSFLGKFLHRLDGMSTKRATNVIVDDIHKVIQS